MDDAIIGEPVVGGSKKPATFLTPEVALLLVLGVVVGVFAARDYGLSWDEYYNETYARHTIEMYLGQRAPGDTITDMRFYGPAFVVPWILLRGLLVKLSPGSMPADAGHVVYWISFLPAPLILYALCRRYVKRAAALAGALLFASQPLIFGHAFVNPKDTPFMTAFLGAVWLGLAACDLSARRERWSLDRIRVEAIRLLGRLMTAWKAAPAPTRIALSILWVGFVLVAVDLLGTHRLLLSTYWLLEHAYAGQSPVPVQALFDWVARDAFKTPLSAYLQKARGFYLWARVPILTGGAGLLAYISTRILGAPISWRWFRRTGAWWAWIIAAIALGVCSAIRVFGPFAGALVVLYSLPHLKNKGWLALVVYGSLSCLVLYGAWPFLWRSPLEHLAEAVFRMGRFPWEGRVLYDGYVYSVTELPWHYVPRTIFLQLTLPAIALSGLGLFLSLQTVASQKRMPRGTTLLLIWFGLPLVTVVLLRVQIYSAFRQLMFILPPLFVLASIGLERVLALARGFLWTLLVIGVALAPGAWGIIRLHPYEMIYYNELVGGVAGASGRYQLDTWGTASREVAGYLNDVAPLGATVFLSTKEHHTMTPFARQDLRIGTWTAAVQQSHPAGAYVVDGGNLSELLQAVTVYTVERERIPLSIVQSLP